jgi:hypothetical protein
MCEKMSTVFHLVILLKGLPHEISDDIVFSITASRGGGGARRPTLSHQLHAQSRTRVLSSGIHFRREIIIYCLLYDQ